MFQRPLLLLFLLAQAALFATPSALAAPKTHAVVHAKAVPRVDSRQARDERLARAFAATFGGAFIPTRQGDALVLDANPRVPRPRAFPKESSRLFRALLRGEAETLGGDAGDDFRIQSYFGEPPSEPRYLEASQRLGATDVAGETPLVRAWFDDEGHLVRARVSGEAMKGFERLPRTARVDEGRAAACAIRGSYSRPTEIATKLVVASRNGAPYLAWNVRALPGAGAFDADVDATTCAVVVHEDKR